MRREIRYRRNNSIVTLTDVPPTQTLLDHLRIDKRAVGTKEGCNEGDCGACTVVLGRVRDGKLVYEPVNACILLTGMVDGCEIITVEDLAEGEALHPVQAAMVAHHGSQCGFCTPGIVMSLFALYQEADRPVTRQAVTDQLAGNLCRCTGYRPIIDAALEVCSAPADDRFAGTRDGVFQALTDLNDEADILIEDGDGFFAAPRSIDALAALYERHPDATLVAGATDVGLWITKQFRPLKKIIWLGRVDRLDGFVETPAAWSIGATVPLERAARALGSIDPDIGELMRRFGSRQVRASGTIGGNIANGSPIGDLAPVLIALDATLYLRKGAAGRTLPAEAFFLAYGKQDRGAGEFLVGCSVPKLADGEVFRCYKISKRFDEDISAVMGAFRLRVEGGRVVEARVAFGGMAAIPKRAPATEAALVGLSLEDGTGWAEALDALASDYQPITDMRASASYRIEAARALLTKALVEVAGADTRETRLIGIRESADAA
ncbi:MAG: xanthine dehydrogenase small subunit [Labrys sp. (in: a-proteobacteria)]